MEELPLLSMAILVPIVGALICAVVAPRWRPEMGMASALATTASVGALIWKFGEIGFVGTALSESLGGWGAPIGIELYADGFALLMVSMTAVIGLFISIGSVDYLRVGPEGEEEAEGHHLGFYWSLWLLAWGGLNAVFLSSDMFNMYVAMEVMGLASVALVALAGTHALSAAFRYLLVTLAGSLFYLFGVALLYGGWGALELTAAGALVEPTVGAQVAFVAMTIGLALKTALVPLHFWLPAAHANAPAPVSALLSALIVKASFFIYVRLWNEVFISLDKTLMAQGLIISGVAAIIFGSVQALRQKRLKMLIAYSTVAQVGYLFIAIGAGAWTGAAYFALSHGLAKAALFLAAGAIAMSIGDDYFTTMRRRMVELIVPLMAIAVAGASLAGLPYTSGYEAKAYIKLTANITGVPGIEMISHLGGILAAAYILIIFYHLLRRPEGDDHRPAPKPVPMGMSLAALVLASMSVGAAGISTPIATLLA